MHLQPPYTMKYFLLLAMSMISSSALNAQTRADLVLLNGKIWTVNPKQPEAEAVACIGSRIIALGSTAEIRGWVGEGTKVIDLGGRRILPGFNDAHVHFYSGGANLSSVQLRDAASDGDFRERLRAFAARLPKGRWITGGDWDHESWMPPHLPTRSLIDDVTPDNPVFVNRLDGHMALANSLTLKLAGITRETADPPGGTIVRDARGEPTGVLKDAAMDAVYRVVPDASHDEIVDAVRAALRYAGEHGVTSVEDMSASAPVLAAYQELLSRNELTVRIYGFQPLGSWERMASVGIHAGFGNEKLKIGGMKGFADGSLGSTTALFFAPYDDAPSTSGLPSEEMIPESTMLNNIIGADRAGLQIGIHAIGDRANQIVLGMFEQAVRDNGPRDRRFRIEHAQHLRKEEIAAFGRQGVIASMQPYHAIDDGRWAEKRIGTERARGTYAFRSLLDAGVTLAFGSDWSVAPMDPIMGIYAAVTRSTLDGKHPNGWIPEQKITVAEAIKAFTLGSAYAAFDENSKGSIETGKLADMVVLSDDILKMKPALLNTAKVMMTIFDGRVIYERPAHGK
jgi:predicted amidohydrolase YtcJ